MSHIFFILDSVHRPGWFEVPAIVFVSPVEHNASQSWSMCETGHKLVEEEGIMHLSMVCPRMGGGGGGGVMQRTQGKCNILSFSNVISPPLGLHYKSNSYPWGSEILLLVDTNFVELLKINTEVSEGEIKILKALLVFGLIHGFSISWLS